MRLSSLEAVFATLNRAGVRYLVAGGVAVIAHGYVRLTRDLDLIIALDQHNVLAALAALASEGYVPRVPVRPDDFADPEQREVWRLEKNMLVFQMVSDRHCEAPIDIFAREPFPFAEEWNRAPRFVVAPGLEVPVVSLDRLLELKRAADRDQDRLDIRMLTERPGDGESGR